MSEQEVGDVRTNVALVALVMLLAVTCIILGWISWAIGARIIPIGGA